MPLTNLFKPDPHTLIALWEMNETLEILEPQITLEAEFQTCINRRKRELLTARILLKQLLKDDFKGIAYDEFRKPYLINHTHELSISHSKNCLGIMLHQQQPCGLDLEHISPKIAKLQRKFMNEEELQVIGDDLTLTTLLWSAKETMYKYYGRKLLDFKEHLFVKDIPQSRKGQFTGIIEKGDYFKTFQVQFIVFEKMVMTYVIQ